MILQSIKRKSRGFSLVEVLIAVIVIAVGLLGIAKMQALAFASTGVASMRSLAALQASSLASAMRADRAYWAAGGLQPPVITVTGTTLAPSFGPIVDCTTAAGPNPPDCSAATVAAYDLQQWATAVNAVLPNPVSTITCPNVAPPVNCTIQITWSEKAVAVNQQGTNSAAMTAPTYVLYVEP